MAGAWDREEIALLKKKKKASPKLSHMNKTCLVGVAVFDVIKDTWVGGGGGRGSF